MTPLAPAREGPQAQEAVARTPAAEVRERIADVLPLIDANAARIHETRRLPDEVVGALRRTGVHRLLLPEQIGGAAAPVVELMGVVQLIATADASTAWCTAIGAGTGLMAGHMPEDGAREVFADPDHGSASVLAPAGQLTRHPRGLRLAGRWAFTSNCNHSAWVGLGARVQTADQQHGAYFLVFVPRHDITVEDTWHTGGLRGTGSHHTSVNDVVVDEATCCSLETAPWSDGPLWRLPPYTALVPLLAVVLLGTAQGALEEARVDALAASGHPSSEDPTALASFGLGASTLAAATAELYDSVREAETAAGTGERVSKRHQARVLLACLRATDTAVELTSMAHRLARGAAVYHGHPLLRRLNDTLTARQHVALLPQHAPHLGRALAGLDVDYQPFLT